MDSIHNGGSTKMVIEWCSHCSIEVKLEYKREYQECPSCKELIAPCSQFAHSDEEVRTHDIPLCVCVKN